MGKRCILYGPFGNCIQEIDDGNPVGQLVGGVADLVGGVARGAQDVLTPDHTSGTSFGISIGGFKWDPLKDIQNLVANPGQEVSRIWDTNIGNPLKELYNQLFPDMGKDSDIPKSPTEEENTYTDQLKRLQGIAATMRGIQEKQLAYPGSYLLNTASDIQPLLNYGMELISTDQVNKNVETALQESIAADKKRAEEKKAADLLALEEAAKKQISDSYMERNLRIGNVAVDTRKTANTIVDQMGKKKMSKAKNKVFKYSPKEIIKKVEKLKSARGTWEDHWQDVTDYVLTRKNTVTTTRTPGEKRAFRLLDNTAVMANEMLAGALHGMLTNPDLQWFEFTTGIPELDNTDEVRIWLQKTSRALHNILNNTNFQTEVHELYIDLPSIGTGCMLMEEHPTDVIRFRTRFIKDYFICENYLGIVDELYYQYKATAKDIIIEFGMEKMHAEVLKAYEKDEHKQFTCVHAVYPRVNKDPEYKGEQKFISQYIIKDLEFELEEGFFLEFPYTVPRWSKAAGEMYGRGPGMNALPEMKVLNKMNETMLIGAQKLVDPPIQMPDDGYIMPIVTTPGGINYYRSGSQEMIKPIFNNTNLEFGYQAMADRQKRVRDCFYIDHLRLQQGGPMMTATEVMQRTEEAMRLLGPMLGRQQVEFLRPLIMRTYGIAARRNLLPEPPEVLTGMKFDVKYSSLIAKAQKVNEAQSIMRAFSAAAPFIQLNPSAADNFNSDQAVRTIVSTYGAPQEILHTQKDVMKIREQKSQQAAAAAQAQQERLDTVNVLDTAKAARQLQGV